jgi:nucleotide-binding universal stress UspA family protein
MFTRIVIAVHDAAVDAAALRVTAEVARANAAAVRVLHVDTSDVVGIAVIDLDDDGAARGVLDNALRMLAAEGVHAEGQLVEALVDDVPDVIARSAEEFGADLVVLAPRHRGAIATWLSPRVTDAVAHLLNRPILLVPAHAA